MNYPFPVSFSRISSYVVPTLQLFNSLIFVRTVVSPAEEVHSAHRVSYS